MIKPVMFRGEICTRLPSFYLLSFWVIFSCCNFNYLFIPNLKSFGTNLLELPALFCIHFRLFTDFKATSLENIPSSLVCQRCQQCKRWYLPDYVYCDKLSFLDQTKNHIQKISDTTNIIFSCAVEKKWSFLSRIIFIKL